MIDPVVGLKAQLTPIDHSGLTAAAQEKNAKKSNICVLEIFHLF